MNVDMAFHDTVHRSVVGFDRPTMMREDTENITAFLSGLEVDSTGQMRESAYRE
jgi:hypothetical protein